jgi:hypothetical protein
LSRLSRLSRYWKEEWRKMREKEEKMRVIFYFGHQLRACLPACTQKEGDNGAGEDTELGRQRASLFFAWMVDSGVLCIEGSIDR